MAIIASCSIYLATSATAVAAALLSVVAAGSTLDGNILPLHEAQHSVRGIPSHYLGISEANHIKVSHT